MPLSTPDLWAKLLKSLRGNMSQRQFANEVRIHYVTICRIERTGKISASTMVRLMDYVARLSEIVGAPDEGNCVK